MALTKANLDKFGKTKKLVEELPDSKRERAAKLLIKLEFMNEEIDKLQAILKEKGWVEQYQNGANQFGLKKSSEGEVYMNLMKTYNSTLRSLNDMLPDDVSTQDELEQWLDK